MAFRSVHEAVYRPIRLISPTNLPERAPYDPVKAGEILDEAGWLLADDGFRYRTRLGSTSKETA